MNKSVLIVDDDPVLQNILWSQLALNGYTPHSDMMHGYQSGCFYYISKPHRLSELLRGLAMATN